MKIKTIKTNANHYTNIAIIVIVLILLYFILHFILYEDIIDAWNKKSDLKKDGFCIIKNMLTSKEVNYLKMLSKKNDYKEVKNYLTHNKKVNKIIKTKTSNEYEFQDYIFIIKRSAIHTCHRDSNGDFFNEEQKYPSYTLLIFLEEMDKCLGVIPESHKDLHSFDFNTKDEVVNLLCKKGDAILFNANLLHVGALNAKDDNLRIQMKVTHKKDIAAIPYYNNYNKILDEDNKWPMYVRKAQRKLSCMAPFFSKLTQSEIQKTSAGAHPGMFQKIFSYLFYGNTNFYNLPNAF